MPKKMKVSGKTNQVTSVMAAAAATIMPSRRRNAPKIEAAPRREHEADADDEEEGAGDRAGEDAPAELVLDVGGDVAEIAKVPGEMVDDHREDGDAARRIDEWQTRGG